MGGFPPVTAGVLLAAGASRRMGGPNKLLLTVGGVPVVRRVALAMLEGGLGPVVVVLGAQGAAVRAALGELAVHFVENPRHGEGMGTSVAAGVAALGPDTGSAAVVVGDLPALRGREVRTVAEAFAASSRGIAVPVREGRRGHPVVFDLPRYRGCLMALRGDQGARALLAERPGDVLEVEVVDPGVLEDLDTPEEYRQIRARWERAGEETRVAEDGEVLRDPTILEELNDLWGPIYPYLADHVLGASGFSSGQVLELGPFSGGIAVEVLGRSQVSEAVVQDEAQPVLRWSAARARSRGVRRRLRTRRAPLLPLPWAVSRFDLVIVRGAFFFLNSGLLREVWRVLRPGGFAWVGGGYGPLTPEEAIRPIADRSRLLNEALGKRWISGRGATGLVADAGLGEVARISEEGGLWIEVRG